MRHVISLRSLLIASVLVPATSIGLFAEEFESVVRLVTDDSTVVISDLDEEVDKDEDGTPQLQQRMYDNLAPNLRPRSEDHLR